MQIDVHNVLQNFILQNFIVQNTVFLVNYTCELQSEKVILQDVHSLVLS